MATVTLSHGALSVDIPLLRAGGELSLARDIGKPNVSTHEVGDENPRTQDYQNATDGWTLAGTLLGDDAYSDARTLAEEIIKPRLADPLTLDLSAVNRGTHEVVPAGESALTLTYTPGQLDIVGVQLSLPSVFDCFGGSQSAATLESGGSGDGFELSNPSTGASVVLDVDNSLTRAVGRPGIKLNPATQDLPLGIDRNKPASDTLELTGVLLQDATATGRTLAEEVVRPRVGDATLTLDCRGTYGLPQFDVMPTGSQALRTATSTGETGVVDVPKIELRTVSNS